MPQGLHEVHLATPDRTRRYQQQVTQHLLLTDPLALLDSCNYYTCLGRPGPFWQCTVGRREKSCPVHCRSSPFLVQAHHNLLQKESQVSSGEQVMSHCGEALQLLDLHYKEPPMAITKSLLTYCRKRVKLVVVSRL